MVDIEVFAVSAAAEFACLGLQARLECAGTMLMNHSVLRICVLKQGRFLAVRVFAQVHAFRAILGFVRDCPSAMSIFKAFLYFPNGTLILSSECVKATVVHEVGQIVETSEVARHVVEIANSTQFRVIGIDNFQLR